MPMEMTKFVHLWGRAQNFKDIPVAKTVMEDLDHHGRITVLFAMTVY